MVRVFMHKLDKRILIINPLTRLVAKPLGNGGVYEQRKPVEEQDYHFRRLGRIVAERWHTSTYVIGGCIASLKWLFKIDH